MNIFLKEFVSHTYLRPGSALDLGAGQMNDVAGLVQNGWLCEGVDKSTGVDLEFSFQSKHGLFDLVYSNYVLHKINNKRQFIQTIHSNLKVGGYFFIHTFDASDMDGTSSDLTIELLRELLQSQGFQNVSVKKIEFWDNDPGHQHWHQILEASGQK